MIVAELGTDMSRFPSDRHAASWAGLCPGNHESAGKRQSGKTRKGNRYLRTPWSKRPRRPVAPATPISAPSTAGWPPAVARRRRPSRSATRSSSSSTTCSSAGTVFDDLGGDYFDRRDQDALERRLVRRLEALGNKVSLEKVA